MQTHGSTVTNCTRRLTAWYFCQCGHTRKTVAPIKAHIAVTSTARVILPGSERVMSFLIALPSDKRTFQFIRVESHSALSSRNLELIERVQARLRSRQLIRSIPSKRTSSRDA